MSIIINLFAIWALCFLVSQTDGPFNLIAQSRNYLMRNKYLGPYFYGLLQCYFCMGTYAGVCVYLLSHSHRIWNVCDIVLWALAGSGIAFGINMMIEKLSSIGEKHE